MREKYASMFYDYSNLFSKSRKYNSYQAIQAQLFLFDCPFHGKVGCMERKWEYEGEKNKFYGHEIWGISFFACLTGFLKKR